jgi:hypothetical protein
MMSNDEDGQMRPSALVPVFVDGAKCGCGGRQRPSLLCNIGQAPGIGLTPDSQAPVGWLILTPTKAL